ncbi:MAG: hypothetical protein HYV60_10465 [Planctomycetia bacterium]|nr:hypothetical protein [Planctomycetia bacterium]
MQYAILVFVALIAPSADAQDPVAPISVWDTGTPSPTRLSSEDLAKRGTWQQISRDQKASSFQGDAVMTNGRILAVLRARAETVDVYYVEAEGPVWRVATRLQAVNGAAASLEAVYHTANGDSVAAKFRIKRGGISLEAAPGPGAAQLRVEAPSRYVVLPDFFADDILIDATKIPVAAAEIPSENFLLHMTGGGNAIAMCVFENSDQDVKVTFAGSGDRRIATGSEIRFGHEGKVWIALLEGRGIWHAFDVASEDAGQIMPLDWQMPFAAQWRTDFTRRNELTDSWEMLYPAEDGDGYIKPSWLPNGPQGGEPSLTATGEVDADAYKIGGPASNRLGPDRQRWITVLGRYLYPCWTDEQQRGYVQPLKHKRDDLMFQGPAVVYPINRLPTTPIDTYTTVDVVRSTLGVGPCEYILSVEGQRQVEIYLGDGLDFVKHIRDRIELYVEFGREMRKYLAAQRMAHPELEKPLTEMEKIVGELDERLVDRRDEIKSPEYVIALNDGFRRNLLNYDGPDSLDRLKAYTDALTGVGGSQDGLVGECRWIVRTLRQRAALAMAVDPEFAEIAKEIRDRTQKVLLKPSAYEGARH